MSGIESRIRRLEALTTPARQQEAPEKPQPDAAWYSDFAEMFTAFAVEHGAVEEWLRLYQEMEWLG